MPFALVFQHFLYSKCLSHRCRRCGGAAATAAVVVVVVGGGGVIVVVVVVVGVVVAVVAATDHRRQCSCANQARGANSRGSQQAPFLVKVVRPTEPYSVRPSLKPLWSAGSQFPGLAANVAQDSNEVSGRVSTSPRGGRSSTWVTPGVAKLADGAPIMPQCFSPAEALLFTRGPAARSKPRNSSSRQLAVF